MEGSFNNRERRRYPRVFIDLPLEYQDGGDSCLHGALVVDASEGGFLIESIGGIPVGMELSITVLYPKGFTLVDFKVVAKIVWKKPYSKKDLKGNQCWAGYQYGLEFVQISNEDRWKLKFLLGDRSNLEEIFTNNEVSVGRGNES
jgi:PilZ domain